MLVFVVALLFYTLFALVLCVLHSRYTLQQAVEEKRERKARLESGPPVSLQLIRDLERRIGIHKEKVKMAQEAKDKATNEEDYLQAIAIELEHQGDYEGLLEAKRGFEIKMQAQYACGLLPYKLS